MTVSAFWLAAKRPCSLHGDSNAVSRMGVHDEMQMRHGGVNGSVDNEAGEIGPVARFAPHIPVPVHDDQRGGRDFLEEHAERVQQERIPGARKRAEIWVLLRSVHP